MTDEEIVAFENWHDRRLAELCYPFPILWELREARSAWVSGVKRRPVSASE